MKIASTIPEAKSMLVRACLREGYRQEIQRGSFADEQYRLQLDYAAVKITNPLFDMVPVPPTIDWPAEQTLSACQKYYQNYLIGSEKADGEEYTYGSRMSRNDQLSQVIDMVTKFPETNQAKLTISDPTDATIGDPACLGEIHFKFFGGQLNMYTIWRSHDLYAGFGMNITALAFLLQDISRTAELMPGSIYYFSSGSHLYGFHVDMLKPLAGGD